MSQFDMQSFANDVYYSMKERNYRELTDDQKATVETQRAAGTWDDQDFASALVQANNLWANDLVEGEIQSNDVEGRLQSLIEDAKATGNDGLTMAVKALVRASLQNDIQTHTVHVPTIHTNARFHLQDRIENDLRKAFDGDTSGLMELAQREGSPDDVNYKMEALAAMGMFQAHHAMNPPVAKAGASAAMDVVAKPN